MPSAGIEGGLIGTMTASLYDAKCFAVRARTRLHLEVGALSQRPVLEPHEHQALVLSAPREIQAGDLERGVDGVAFVMQQIVRHVVQHVPRAPCVAPGGVCTWT